MFGKTRAETVKDNAATAADFVNALARDKKFRKQLAAAGGHGVRAQQRASARIGMIAVISRLAADDELRGEIRQMAQNLQGAWARLEHKRSHRGRNVLLVLIGAAGAAAAALPTLRERARKVTGGTVDGMTPRTVEADIEVEAPVSVVYNQWTQFEEFPQFMAGVDEVRQLDDTRLHWVASIGGTRAEWDAKILEQHPDRQISWISEDGKKNRGTVTFEPIGESRTRVHLSMGYQAEGFREAIGAAAGIRQPPGAGRPRTVQEADRGARQRKRCLARRGLCGYDRLTVRPTCTEGLRGGGPPVARRPESSPGWTRTNNPPVNSRMLCQLSYRGLAAAIVARFSISSRSAAIDSASGSRCSTGAFRSSSCSRRSRSLSRSCLAVTSSISSSPASA